MEHWKSTFTFEVTGGDAAWYLSLTALSLAMMSGKIGARPGTKLKTQINSFSIQLRSWLLQTDIMKTVCNGRNKIRRKPN